MKKEGESRFWRSENWPFIIIGAVATLGLIAAGIYFWVVEVAPAIAHLARP